jgi:WD40 repeat protein
VFIALACVGAAPPVQEPLRERLRLLDKETTPGCLAFSPDGKRFATTHERRGEQRGSELHVRDVGTGKTIVKTWVKDESFDGRPGLHFLPDGKTLVALVSRGPYLFAADTLEIRSRPERRTPGLYRALFVSRDGKSLGACLYTASVWRLQPKVEQTATLHLERRGVGESCFSPDLRLLAMPNHQDVDLWDVARGKIVRSLLDHRGSGAHMAFSTDGRTLAVATHRGTDEGYDVGEVRLWEVSTGKLLGTIDLGRSYTRTLAFSPDGKRIALADGLGGKVRGRLRLFDVATRKEIARVQLGWRDPINSLTFDPTGATLGTVHWDDSIRLWRVRK